MGGGGYYKSTCITIDRCFVMRFVHKAHYDYLPPAHEAEYMLWYKVPRNDRAETI